MWILAPRHLGLEREVLGYEFYNNRPHAKHVINDNNKNSHLMNIVLEFARCSHNAHDNRSRFFTILIECTSAPSTLLPHFTPCFFLFSFARFLAGIPQQL